jgi:hypothetical protein
MKPRLITLFALIVTSAAVLGCHATGANQTKVSGLESKGKDEQAGPSPKVDGVKSATQFFRLEEERRARMLDNNKHQQKEEEP